jgi:hypothetical protein
VDRALADFLFADAHIFIRQIYYRELTTPWDKPLAPPLYVMDKRHKQKLERDLERYRALLKLSTDQRALAALKQLIKETTDRLNDINNSEQRAPL